MKENAAWALGYIGKHSEQLAGLVVDAGTLPLLVLAFQEPEMSLKQARIKGHQREHNVHHIEVTPRRETNPRSLAHGTAR